MVLRKRVLENVALKGENAGHLHFLHSCNVLYPTEEKYASLELSSAKSFNLGKSNILSCNAELILNHTTLTFDYIVTGSFRKHCGKGENAGEPH